jgi:hypothetical protein
VVKENEVCTNMFLRGVSAVWILNLFLFQDKNCLTRAWLGYGLTNKLILGRNEGKRC